MTQHPPPIECICYSVDRSPRSTLVAVAALTGVAIVYGATYSMTKDAVMATDAVGFLAVRFALGAAVLWPFARRRVRRRGEFGAGLAGGLALFAGYVLQGIGLETTTSAGAALALNLMVVVVPIAGAVIARRLPPRRTVMAAACAIVGSG